MAKNNVSLQDFIDKYKKDLPKGSAKSVGTGSALAQLTPEDFLTMPQWWQDATKTPGLPYGQIVMIAGDTDSGKTSSAIQAMKAAQDKDIQVFYAETENKTNTSDFIKWGVDPDKILVIQETIAERLYESLFTYIRGFKETYPDKELLVIIDSMGNVVSQRSQDMDLTEQSDKPGEKGKINRQMLEILISLVRDNSARIATLLINYTYDNIGYAKGKTAAGGKGPMQFSSLVYQTQRKGTIFKTVDGQKTKVAAEVLWTLVKNHIYKDNPGAYKVTMQIDAKGIQVTGKQEETDEE